MCHGLGDRRDAERPLLSFSLSLVLSLSLLLSVAGAELIAGSRPRPTPTEIITPDVHQGEWHLSQERTAGRCWIVVCHALVKVELQSKISQVFSVNIGLTPLLRGPALNWAQAVLRTHASISYQDFLAKFKCVFERGTGWEPV
uniref:DUF4939 domain-containing protein n=1 Tax=Oreochromis aureus TaxID=47969 RepID=A0AAZ1XLS0_OREAU